MRISPARLAISLVMITGLSVFAAILVATNLTAHQEPNSPVLVDSHAPSIYEEFNTFCLENFGAEREPLVYGRYGAILAFVESGFWIHESRNSAAVAFETTLPARTRIEFGETASYGQTTEMSDRAYYLHLHHIKDLEPDRTYHYRFIATDERDNTVHSSNRTFQTHSLPEHVNVPGSLEGPPFVLDTPDTQYILTEDIVSDTRGISIKARGVSLDLNGHRVTYDEGPPIVEGDWNEHLYSDSSSTGIHFWIWNPTGVCTIRNGEVVQGQNMGQGHINVGFNPILIYGGTAEIAGVAVDYAGHSVGGISNHNGALVAHHNVILDRGTGIDNRHQGIKAINCRTVHPEGLHHNLIKRARQQGIITGDGGGPVYSNEIYIDSYDTNSFGLRPTSLVEGNRIFGTGYHVVAIGWISDVSYQIRNNFIHLQGVAPSNRSEEYGAHSSVNGMRLTQYSGSTRLYEDILYEGNTIIVKAREGCNQARGTQFFSDPHVVNLRFRNNIIKTEVQDDETPIAPCVVAHGQGDRAEDQRPVFYENNLFMTNSVFVRFGDSYACGGNHQFRNNELVRFGQTPDHSAIRMGYWIWPSYGNRFIDTVCGAGVDLEDNVFDGSASARLEYSVGHSLYIRAKSSTGETIALDSLWVSDCTGTNYRTRTGADGDARIELLEYTYLAPEGQAHPAREGHSDHTLLVDGYEPFVVTPELFAIGNNHDDPVEIIFTP